MVSKKILVTIGILLSLFAAAVPLPAYALEVHDVAPKKISNDTSNTITVTGKDFVDGAVVLLNGNAIPTTFLNDSTLTAVVPEGFKPGTYDVEVRIPAETPVVCGCKLKVVAPSATEVPPFSRPQMAVAFSGANVKQISTGEAFKFTLNLNNVGAAGAFNTIVTFASSELVPMDNGGVVAAGNVPAAGGVVVDQRFISAESLSGKTLILIDASVTYYDAQGNAFSDKFTLSVPVKGAGGGGGTGVIVTPTPTGVRSGQLIIPSYAASIDPLQPGSQFALSITVQNTGNDKAQRVTMIVGGGSSGGSEGGTPQPGGVSGGSGEFTNFAPLGTSNIQSLGDIPAGGVVQASQDLIVNVSTNPGAYPMKITFSYINGNGDVVNDEQVITLLVFSLPNVEVSFYRPLDPFFAGQPAPLPIQIVNLGKRTAVLGTMTVAAQGGVIENGTSLVGSLDAGGYFTLDPLLSPDTAGVVKLNIVIDYTDDFNRPRTIEKTLEVTVEEGFIEPPFEPGMGEGNGGEFPPSEETFLQKVWRFILGLFGLDSAPPPSTPDMQSPPQFEPEALMPGGGSGPKG
jgi:hypothetical protein